MKFIRYQGSGVELEEGMLLEQEFMSIIEKTTGAKFIDM